VVLFHGSRLKIERANKHITDLDQRIGSLPDSDVATVEINPEGGNEVIKHDFGDDTVIADIALMAGDAVHNLKCALDYSWLETVKRVVPSAISKFAKFPIYPTRNELEAALRGKEIHVASPNLFALMLDNIQPYDGGNFAVWTLHRLDIRDKHRLLIPVISYSSISGIATENKRTGETTREGFTMLTDQKPPLYVPMPPDVHVTDKGKIAISVMFEYGMPGREGRIVDSFSLYSHFILQIVQTLETFVETVS
jgi:hypothetical protein